MLVLSRRQDEAIIISDTIEITVLEIRGKKVKIGIAAPTEISVFRKEIYKKEGDTIQHKKLTKAITQ